MIRAMQQILETLPDKPGIYLFYNAQGVLIYVGKATSLKNRVRSYFVGKRTSRPIEALVHEVVKIRHKITESALEAAILESVYIKKHQPKYNVLGKDNKSWNYIVVTKADYPEIKTLRQHTLASYSESEQKKQFHYIFGPYPGLNTTATLKILRRLFLFSTCQNIKNNKKSLLRGETSKQSFAHNANTSVSAALQRRNDEVRPCLYYQMGECLGVCTGEISSKDYKARVIAPLVKFLRGNKKYVIRDFEKRMKVASKQEHYEEAARLRDQIANLQKIYDITMINESFVQDAFAGPDDGGVARIEGYDISNLGSNSSVGSMVVFEHGKPKKSEYRKFRVKTVVGKSDVDSIDEVMRRRLARSYDIPITNDSTISTSSRATGRESRDLVGEIITVDARDFSMRSASATLSRNDVKNNKASWPKPDVLLIDGGRPQVNRVQRVLDEFQIQLPIVGIAKGAERKKNEFIFPENASRTFIRWVADHQRLLVRVRDEAHRFALSYQRQTRKIQ